jgi:hypothetical protein
MCDVPPHTLIQRRAHGHGMSFVPRGVYHTDSRDWVGPTHGESTPLGAAMESPQTHGPPPQGAALMTRTDKYVALDVHQATTLPLVRAETG